jgi:hypothetical protein
MHRYRVIGYDAKGERLFTLRVEALTKTDARLMAMALLRRNRSGAALANRAERLVVRRDSPDEERRAALIPGGRRKHTGGRSITSHPSGPRGAGAIRLSE